MAAKSEVKDLLTEYVKHRAGEGAGVPDPVQAWKVLVAVDKHPQLVSNNVNFGGEPRLVLDVHRVHAAFFKAATRLDFKLEPGLTLYYGDNDTGKTATVEALRVGLGGQKGCSSKALLDVIQHGHDAASVDVEATGVSIARGVSRAAGGKMEHSLDVQWEGNRERGVQKGTALLGEYLGAPVDFVLASCLMGQGQIDAILSEDPADRRRDFYGFLGLAVAENTRKLLAAAHTETKARFDHVEGRAKEARDELLWKRGDRKAIDVAQITADMATLRASVKDDTALRHKADALASNLAGVTMQIASARGILDQEAARVRELDALRASPLLAQAMDDQAVRLEQARASLAHHQRALGLATGKRAAVDAAGRAIKDLPPVCATCAAIGKTCELTQEAKDAALAEKRAAWIAADGEVAKEEDAVQRLASDVEQLTTYQQERGQLLRWKADALAGIEALEKRKPEGPMPDPVKLEKQRAEAEKALKASGAAPVADDELEQALTAGEDRLKRAAVLDAEIEKLEEEAALDLSALALEIDLLAWLRDAFSQNGIPLWIARRHLARINQMADELSAGDRFRYWFDGDLQVRVSTQDDQDIAPGQASGSARERGALVLVLARSLYMQELTGITIPILWLDEVKFQDGKNAEYLFHFLLRLKARIPKIVLASSDYERWLALPFDHKVTSADVVDLGGNVKNSRREYGHVHVVHPVEMTVAEMKAEFPSPHVELPAGTKLTDPPPPSPDITANLADLKRRLAGK